MEARRFVKSGLMVACVVAMGIAISDAVAVVEQVLH